MPELPRVVANNTPYIEDRGIWRITVTGSYETNCSHYFSVTLDTDNDLNFITALNWIHSQCRKQFVAVQNCLSQYWPIICITKDH